MRTGNTKPIPIVWSGYSSPLLLTFTLMSGLVLPAAKQRDRVGRRNPSPAVELRLFDEAQFSLSVTSSLLWSRLWRDQAGYPIVDHELAVVFAAVFNESVG